MAIDREETLKKAEKLLRQGRLDAAIVEYQRVVDEYPRDWNTANTLGDCFYRAHQVERAVEQYNRIADHFAKEGFLPKAGALYKKVLKIKADDEHALTQAAEIAIRQGTLAEAKQHLGALAERRRTLGDAHGAADALLKLGSLDPDDLDARLAAARAVAADGGASRVAGEFRAIADALVAGGDDERALDVLVEASELAPDDASIRAALASSFVARGDFARARAYATTTPEFVALADAIDARGDRAAALEMIEHAIAAAPGERTLAERLVRGYLAADDRERARVHVEALGDINEPDLLRAAAELRADAGQYDIARGLFARLLAREPHHARAIAERGASLAASSLDAALVHVESAAETLVLHGDFAGAAAAYQAFLERQRGHVGASLRLVEICVDGGLQALPEAQAALVDAYLAAGRGPEALAVAEDLVSTDRGNAAHVDRLRRALVLAGEPDVDAAVAARLSVDTEVATGALDLSDEPGATRLHSRPSDDADTGDPGSRDGRKGRRRKEPAPPAGERDQFGLGPIAIDLRDILGEDLDGSPQDETPGRDAPEIDLSDALADLKGPPLATPAPAQPPATLDGVFADFRQEVDKQSEADAAEKHFKVGITYEEMGMLAEAARELEIAVRAPRLRFEAASRLARVALKSDRPLDAIEWFERAAEAPAPTLEAGRTLLYDLGDTLEGRGETARALAVFLELQADAADFRDVARRVERLTRLQTGG